MEKNDEIKEIEEKDLEELIAIYKEAFNSNIKQEEVEKTYAKMKELRDVYWLGYYIEGKIVGTLTLYIIVKPTGKQAMIWDLAVKEEKRRKGIATKLMHRAEEIVKQEGEIDKIWLFSRFTRKGAHELYRKLGYDENRDKAFVKSIKD